jgi:hypothetical protein
VKKERRKTMIKKITPIVGISAEYIDLPSGGVKVLKVVRKSTGHVFTDETMFSVCESNIVAILKGWMEVPQC